MEEFFPFFLIIFAGLFFSMLFNRLHVPWVVGLILGGILIGPHALGFLTITPPVEFISQMGLVFLMFMAGLETNLSSFNNFRTGLFGLSLINGGVPFVFGVGVAFLFGYGWLSALLVGIIFISSSIAVVIPSLEKNDLLHTKLGQSVVLTSVIQDIISLIFLSFVLQSVSPITKLPLYVFYPLIIISLFVIRLLIPKVNHFFTKSMDSSKDLFQQQFRAVFVVILLTVVVFEFLGLHPIIAGFFTGLVLANSITSQILREKIRTISYGIFIPTFFVVIGAQTDISILADYMGVLPLVLAIVGASVFSKFVSGWLGGRIFGFTSDQSLLFAVSSIPQLSTTLAVAFAALSLGFIDKNLITAMVALSVATVIISPLLMSIFINRIKRFASLQE